MQVETFEQVETTASGQEQENSPEAINLIDKLSRRIGFIRPCSLSQRLCADTIAV